MCRLKVYLLVSTWFCVTQAIRIKKFEENNKENIRNSFNSNGTIEEAKNNVTGQTNQITFDVGDSLRVSIRETNNFIDFSLNIKNSTELSRGMKSSMQKMVPYMVVPALVMAGIMPWVMPGLQLATSTVSMINQMAFTSSLVMLIRSYIFDTKPDEHVVYVNHGYKNKGYKNKEHYHK